MKNTIFIFIIFLHIHSKAQYLLPQQVKGCTADNFCLDCGDPKAGASDGGFTGVESYLNQKYNFKGSSGQIAFQVLVDTLGHGCVMSHTDKSSGGLSRDIMDRLNAMAWSPARTKGRPQMSSIMVLFTVEDGKLVGKVDRPDYAKAMISHGNPGEPQIFNKQYRYTNDNLGTYELQSWLPSKSGMQSDMGMSSVVDTKGVVWHSTYSGFAKFESGVFKHISSGTPFPADVTVRSLNVARSGTVWASFDGKVYRESDGKWTEVEMPRKLGGVYDIGIGDDGSVLVCSDTGLIELSGGKTLVYDQARVPQMKYNAIFAAYRDHRGRLWIGTMKGTVMIEGNGFVHDMTVEGSPLRESTITDIDEDEMGNLYFALYDLNGLKTKGRDKPGDGFAILDTEGKWKHYTDANSGMPANHVNDLLYDRVEKVLWIATNDAGLVRFDLKHGWENYHNKNSGVPSSYVFQLSQDGSGDLYAATFNGLLRLRKKK